MRMDVFRKKRTCTEAGKKDKKKYKLKAEEVDKFLHDHVPK